MWPTALTRSSCPSRAAGIEPGDEVILPTNSFIATAEAVTRAGGSPVLVDCDPDDLLIDPAAVGARIGSSTRAVVPVHLYGRLAPMEALHAAVDNRSVLVIEDAAQAQGARRNGRGIGGWAQAAATSFYPGKNLGAYGDGGAVLTNDAAIAADVRSRRDHGRAGRHHHELIGTNSRLDTLQAVVLRAKLRHLHEWNALRIDAAARYQEMLSDFPGVTVPRLGPEGESVWHLYVVRVRNRDAVLAALHEAGIGAGVHYLLPIHLQPAFAYLGYSRRLPSGRSGGRGDSVAAALSRYHDRATAARLRGAACRSDPTCRVTRRSSCIPAVCARATR